MYIFIGIINRFNVKTRQKTLRQKSRF